MRALLVVDVQEDVMKSRDTEGLIGVCNDIITGYAPEQVIYIANLRPFAKEPTGNPMASGLAIVSENLFYKKRPDAFSNRLLIERLRKLDMDELEIIGIDGNWCIKATALGALRNGLKASVNTSAVVSKNPSVFTKKTVPLLEQAGVEIVGAN